MLDRGLRRRFDPQVEREARDRRRAPGGGGGRARLDLRSLPTFTIDPPTARDFDDAISAERLDDGAVRVWVHIADVSHYVRPGSAVDREAFRRATSVYVPGAVEPMLPEALSNRACSLVPHQDRLAVTVELELRGREGAPLGVPPLDDPLGRAPGLPAVDRIFAGAERARGPVGGAAGRGAARRGGAPRGARGSAARWPWSPSEPEFAFSREGHVTELACERADRVAPADRAPDDRRQRGGGDAA